MKVVSRQTAEHYGWGGNSDGWRLLFRSDLSVMEERIPPGEGEVRHLHERARQLFYVLAGQLEVELPDGLVVLSGGDAVEVPPGVAHRVQNHHNSDARFLVISSPTTVGDRVKV